MSSPVLSRHDMMPSGRCDLAGLSRPALAAALADLGEADFRVRQLWRWIYQAGVTDFDQMSDLSKDFRRRLADGFVVGRPEVIRRQVSEDGTRKWLLKLPGGGEVETVYIPEEDRGALCVSSQIGCTLTCRFCRTGTQGWVRNLSAAEIVLQLMMARDDLQEWHTPEQGRRLSHIVLMGMGEPLYNYDEVATALGIMMDSAGLAISRRKITLSTAGVVPMMERCGRELGVKLAVSLHAVDDALRDVLVPLNRKYPIARLLEACRSYSSGRRCERITFEYVMLKGVNDSPQDARTLARMLRDIPAKVNLIPFNPWPGASYETSSPAAIASFADILNAAGLAAPVRATRGRDILAACGQLRSGSIRLRKSQARTQQPETISPDMLAATGPGSAMGPGAVVGEPTGINTVIHHDDRLSQAKAET